MRIVTVSSRVVERDGRPLLEAELILEAGDTPVDVDQLIVPRAQIGGVVHPILAVKAVGKDGEPVFPLAPVPNHLELRVEILLPRRPSRGDWLLVHLVLRGGNRLAYRAAIEPAEAGLALTFTPQDGSRKWFLFGLLGTFALLVTVRQLGDRYISPSLASDLRNAIDLAIGALLGAVALPNFFSFPELFSLLRRPETRVSPPLFLTISHRAWTGTTLGGAVLVLFGAGFLGHLAPADPAIPQLAWYQEGGRSRLEPGRKLNRFELNDLALAVVDRDIERPFVRLGWVEPASLRPLFPTSRDLQVRVREREFDLQLDTPAWRVLLRSPGCERVDLDALVAGPVVVSRLLTASCLEPIRSELLRELGGAKRAEEPGKLAVHREEGSIRVAHAEAMKFAELEELVMRGFRLAAYRNALVEEVDDSVGAFEVGGFEGKRVDADTCADALALITGRWEPERSSAFSRRNTVGVVLARRLFEFCDDRWEREAERQIAFERFAEELARRLFVDTARGPAPVCSDATLQAYFRFLTSAARREGLRPELLARSKNAGERTQAALLVSLLDGDLLDRSDAAYRKLLRDRFRDYTRYQRFRATVEALQTSNAEAPAKVEFLDSILA